MLMIEGGVTVVHLVIHFITMSTHMYPKVAMKKTSWGMKSKMRVG